MAVDNWLIALLLKPFAALALLTGTLLLARWIHPHIPNGRIKQVLYDPTLRHRYPWRFAFGCMVGCWGVAFVAYLLV